MWFRRLTGMVRHPPDATLALFQLEGFRRKWMHELHLEAAQSGLREE